VSTETTYLLSCALTLLTTLVAWVATVVWARAMDRDSGLLYAVAFWLVVMACILGLRAITLIPA
jgi:hypothetical protein